MEIKPSDQEGDMQENCEPEICYAISNFTAEEDNQVSYNFVL